MVIYISLNLALPLAEIDFNGIDFIHKMVRIGIQFFQKITQLMSPPPTHSSINRLKLWLLGDEKDSGFLPSAAFFRFNSIKLHRNQLGVIISSQSR